MMHGQQSPPTSTVFDLVNDAEAVAHHDIDAGRGLHLYIAESGNGPPLVLLHGFTGSAETWTPFRQMFESAYRFIAIDQPGHGRSSSPADPSLYLIDRFGDALSRVFDSFRIDRAVLVGYSMGGRAALRFAVDHLDRVAGLVLESTSPGIADGKQRFDRTAADTELADLIELDGIEKFVRRWERLPLWDTQRRLSDKTLAGQHERRLTNNPTGLANSLRGAGAGKDLPMLDAAMRIRVPALLIAGALDSKYVALGGLLEKAIPDSRLKVIPNSGHAVHLEQPEAFAATILEFLSTIPSARGRWKSPIEH
ncbi:MAG: 2-succinyl-6-hydroxy-2,4-cyclohexadiene-1-carboxylate synthase [Gemmatimonadaceae bacterium]